MKESLQALFFEMLNSLKFQMFFIYIYIYDRGLIVHGHVILRHMCRRNAAVAVKHGDSLRKLVSLGSPRINTLCVDMESAISPYTLTVH
jgi:hypothetical protein